MIIGNDTIRRYFERAVESAHLHHGYCFIGPRQVGKRTLAKYIAALLLKVPVERLATQPDFMYVGRVLDEKTGKLPKELSVETARQLRERLQGRSWLGGYRVVIIDEAELLSVEASNALLKTLEEPPEKTIIFLLTENEEKLLPTIRSRVQVFTLGLTPEKEIVHFLEALGAGERAPLLAAIAEGRPGLAQTFFQNPEAFEAWENEAARFRKVVGESFADKVKSIESLFKEEEGERVAEKSSAVLTVWISLFRQALQVRVTGFSPLSRYLPEQAALGSLTHLLESMDRLTTAKELLARNVQPRLAVEQAIIEF